MLMPPLLQNCRNHYIRIRTPNPYWAVWIGDCHMDGSRTRESLEAAPMWFNPHLHLFTCGHMRLPSTMHRVTESDDKSSRLASNVQSIHSPLFPLHILGAMSDWVQLGCDDDTI
ncbi:hypothetical protein CDAR_454781 [Caerostris darwini]|uniref:Uncharacterized protein n=1 Tax=Caerostris darwini TaxID=1538125 RepID=A0AAV4TX15_9ARAC|nr:hypothetical protein CDAR_454781 [Caerostris darwini]